MELSIDEAVTPKKYLKFSDGYKEMINNITNTIETGEGNSS